MSLEKKKNKRTGPIRSQRYCKYCKAYVNHTSIMCWKKPRNPIKQESDKARLKRRNTANSWFALNPPDEDGWWYCYLRISSLCLKRMTRDTVTLEHVKPKSSRPELKYRADNIKPACGPCNRMKGSQSLERLTINFPHLAQYLEGS